MKRFALGMALALSVWLIPPACHAQDSLERGLYRQAPKLIKYCKEHGYKKVGVLKFLVSRADKGFTDNVGALNLLAARRLELALILANDPRNPVGIIGNASEVARKIAGASHLSKEGRERLFNSLYPLAWGKSTVQPDAFITGTIAISKDLRTLTVSLYGFDRATNKLISLGEDFQVANTIDRLSEMGESFVLRGAFDDGETEIAKTKNQEKVFQEAVKVHDQQTKHPAQVAQQPVLLEIRYDGAIVPLEYRDGKAFIREPREGEAVEFRLTHDSSKERYGVVLKVNGENTLEKERLPDLSCHKWILDPGYGPWAVRGYQIGDVLEKFRVASIAESKQREVYYGHDVGTITMTVFRELKSKPQRKLEVDDFAQYQSVIKKVAELPKHANNYNALKAQLLEDANKDDSRGLIVSGEKEALKVETVPFTADPDPIMCLTIVYRK